MYNINIFLSELIESCITSVSIMLSSHNLGPPRGMLCRCSACVYVCVSLRVYVSPATVLCLFTSSPAFGTLQRAIKSFKWLSWHFIICRSQRQIAICPAAQAEAAATEELRVGVTHRPVEAAAVRETRSYRHRYKRYKQIAKRCRDKNKNQTRVKLQIFFMFHPCAMLHLTVNRLWTTNSDDDDDADFQRRRAINCILFARRLFVANQPTRNFSLAGNYCYCQGEWSKCGQKSKRFAWWTHFHFLNRDSE